MWSLTSHQSPAPCSSSPMCPQRVFQWTLGQAFLFFKTFLRTDSKPGHVPVPKTPRPVLLGHPVPHLPPWVWHLGKAVHTHWKAPALALAPRRSVDSLPTVPSPRALLSRFPGSQLTWVGTVSLSFPARRPPPPGPVAGTQGLAVPSVNFSPSGAGWLALSPCFSYGANYLQTHGLRQAFVKLGFWRSGIRVGHAGQGLFAPQCLGQDWNAGAQ